MYTSYDEMAKLLGITDFISNNCNKCLKEKGIIINFRPHLLDLSGYSDAIVVAVYLPRLKQNIIIGTRGLKILSDPIYLPDELFEL